jgi:hypothetical protein
MTTISIKTESPLETANLEDQTDRKLFDNYGPVNVKESIGTFFLGILAILLFLALQRFWNCYEGLITQIRLPNKP